PSAAPSQSFSSGLHTRPDATADARLTSARSSTRAPRKTFQGRRGPRARRRKRLAETWASVVASMSQGRERWVYRRARGAREVARSEVKVIDMKAITCAYPCQWSRAAGGGGGRGRTVATMAE